MTNLRTKSCLRIGGKNFQADQGSDKHKDVFIDDVVLEAYDFYKKESLFFYADFKFRSSKFNEYFLKSKSLKPSQITDLLAKTISETSEKDLTSVFLGLYLSALIQKSYADGNNDFVLIAGDTKIRYLGNFLKGTKERNINIRVIGNVGWMLGSDAEFCEYSVTENAEGFLGSKSVYCKYLIQGAVAEGAGYQAESCEFQLNGHIDFDVGFESSSSVYKSNKPEVYQILKWVVPWQDALVPELKNLVILIE